MNKNQVNEIKKVVQDLIKNELNNEFRIVLKSCVKEVIYEYFGGKSWLSDLRIELMAKEVLKDLLICELKDININFKIDPEIKNKLKRNSEKNEDIIYD